MSKPITLLTWPDYIDPKTVQQFESEFGVKVDLDIVPSAVELIERMTTAGRVDAQRHTEAVPDVLCPPDYAVRELSARGRLANLDHSRIPNLVHIDNRFREGRAHDPESRYSVVKDWGTTGFMYRTDIVDGHPNSWADFWKLACSAKFSGQVTILDSPGEVIGAALKMRGHSYNAVDLEALAQARADLLELKQNLFAFETNYKPFFLSGEICLALGWNGDAAALIAQSVPIKYVVPAEGSQIWEDDWAIAAQSSNKDAAHTFLNFILQPEVTAQEARYTRYATGNRSALALLEDEMKNDPATYPPEGILRKLEPGMPFGAEGQKRREDLWREVREPLVR